MDQKTIREYIRGLEHMIGFLRSLLEEELKAPPPPQSDRDRISELTDLRLLCKSDQWPQAVPEDLICGEDEDHKLARAAGIVNDFIKTDLTDKTFLDFGCGEGHVPYIAANLVGVKKAVGYDLKDEGWEHFEDTDNLIYSTNWQNIKDNGPYDVILLSDVLDHANDPQQVMEQIKQIKKPHYSKIYVRCHPWVSRHGSHLYKQLNKAYLHMVFNEDELFGMGFEQTKTTPLLDPIAFYRNIFKESGFTILQEEKIIHPVELFFTHKPEILRRIKEKWKTSSNTALSNGTEFPREILELQFVDYVLI